MTPRSLILLAALAATPLVASCGKLGDLEKPAPLFGEQARIKYEAERRAAAARNNETNRPSEPGTNRENIDPATSNATSRQAPVRGTNPDPFSGPSGPGFPNSGPGSPR